MVSASFHALLLTVSFLSAARKTLCTSSIGNGDEVCVYSFQVPRQGNAAIACSAAGDVTREEHNELKQTVQEQEQTIIGLQAELRQIQDRLEPGHTEESEMPIIFRATTGLGPGVSIYDAWRSDVSMNADRFGLHVRTLNSSVRGIYKSGLAVQQWCRIEQVKVAVYKEGVEGFNMVFNAVGTDKMNWFSAGNLVSTSYADLATETHNHFSIAGSSGYNRRFYVNHNYGGCNFDNGWFAISEHNGDNCDWETAGDSSPTFLYSQGITRSLSTGWVRGDLLVFYAKLKAE